MSSREVCIHNREIKDNGDCSCEICYPKTSLRSTIATLRAERDKWRAAAADYKANEVAAESERDELQERCEGLNVALDGRLLYINEIHKLLGMSNAPWIEERIAAESAALEELPRILDEIRERVEGLMSSESPAAMLAHRHVLAILDEYTKGGE